VRKGELLFEIDERPFQYALERALSDQATLEGQIVDETRRIAALKSAVVVSEANIHSVEADVVTAEKGVTRAQAEWEYANTNLHRLVPLLRTQAVSADDVDKSIATRCLPTHLQAPGERHVSTRPSAPESACRSSGAWKESMAIHSYRHDAPKGALPRAVVAAMLLPCCGFVAGPTSISPRIYRAVADVAGPARGSRGCSSQPPSFSSSTLAPRPTISD
jgi:hypothetical protein